MFAPPPHGSFTPHYRVVPAGSALLRISRHSSFRHFEPLDFRFDHHVMGGSPEERGIFYGVPSLECCIAEVYDDLGAVYLDSSLIIPEVRRPLRLLDLRGACAGGAGLPDDIATYQRRPETQEWSRFIYAQADLYDAVDGLLYTGRHAGLDAYALYERCEPAIYSPGVKPYAYPLSDHHVREHVLEIANQRGLAVFNDPRS